MNQFYDTYALQDENSHKKLQLNISKDIIIAPSLRAQFKNIRDSLLIKLS